MNIILNIFNGAYIMWHNQNYWTVSGRNGCCYQRVKQIFEIQTK